jgi:hypothetical protein
VTVAGYERSFSKLKDRENRFAQFHVRSDRAVATGGAGGWAAAIAAALPLIC